MMQPILAEFCGRWGCTWWEGILTVIFVTIFKSPTGFVIILLFGAALLLVSAVLLLVSAALALLLIGVLAYQIGAIANWIRGKHNTSNADKFQQRDKRILSTGNKLLAHATKVLAPSDDSVGKVEQQEERILSTKSELLSRARKILDYNK